MCDVCKSLGILKKRKEFHIWICSQCWDEDRGAIEEEEEE
jgi:ribosomal protein L37AE/L43A